MAAAKTQDDDIRKYEEIGTHPAANHNAISAALAFHRGIGSERKVARLRYLRDRWAKRLLSESPRVKVLTPLDSNHSGALALFNVDGLPFDKLGPWLMSKHHIVNTPIKHDQFNGIRITPNVYTTIDEIDLMDASARRGAFDATRVATRNAPGARFADVDLRGAELGSVVGIDGLRGATISALQLQLMAPALAELAGLVVED